LVLRIAQRTEARIASHAHVYDEQGSGRVMQQNEPVLATEPQVVLSPADTSTAIVHLYRAQSAKADSWRARLDATTNWAVVTTAAAITFALGDTAPQRHGTIPLISILVTFFLVLEARRYRHYDIWQTRVQLLEADFFAPLLTADAVLPHLDWRRLLAADLRHPQYHISFAEAFGWRLRRNYIWIYAILLLTWLIKVSIHPIPVSSVGQFIDRASLGPIPGWATICLGALFNGSLLAIAFITSSLHSASGEIMTQHETRERIRQDAAPPPPGVVSN
jgi:uncharacterized membrane protein